MLGGSVSFLVQNELMKLKFIATVNKLAGMSHLI